MTDPAPSDLEALVAKAQIEALHDRYLAALDARDAEAYAACFTEAGELVVLGHVSSGHCAIKRVLLVMDEVLEAARQERGPGAPIPIMRHMTTNHAITLSGARARHRASWITVMNGPDDRVTIPTMGHYEDELVRQAGTWLFARRAVNQDIP